jgi:hypothetical protein
MTIHLFTSDTHCGGETALMPPVTYNHSGDPVMMMRDQSPMQDIIYRQWLDVGEKVKQMRGKFSKKQIIHYFNGDAVEGDHHGTRQLVTKYLINQAYMHVQCVKDLREVMGWRDTDRMIYTDGTETHVGEFERLSSDLLGAEHYPVIKKKTPAGQLWVAHHGATPGKAHTSGNALRNKAKAEVRAALEAGREPPRFIVYSHYHTKRHITDNVGIYEIDAWILPSFQYKTGFGYRVAPFEPEDIGGMVMQIEGDGLFNRSSWEWLTLEREERILE